MKKNRLIKTVLISSLLPLTIALPLVSASCIEIKKEPKKPDTTNPEITNEEKNAMLVKMINDYDNHNQYNANHKYQFDKYSNDKYEVISNYLVDILKHANLEKVSNLSEDNINKIKSLFRLKQNDKLNLEDNNNLSLNQRIERLKQNYYVYSPLQDYLDNKINNDKNKDSFKAIDNIYVYDFAKKQNNKELNYNFNQNNIDKLVVSQNQKYDISAALSPKEVFQKANQEYQNFLEEYNKKETLTNDDFNNYLQKAIDNYWMNLNYQSQFYNGFKRMWNTYLTDNVWKLAKNNYDYYINNENEFKANQIEIKEEYNPVFKNAKMMVSNDVNSQMPIIQRNIKLFSGRGQGTDLFSNDNKMYILTAKHVIKFMTDGNKFIKNKLVSWQEYDPQNQISIQERKKLSPNNWEYGITLDFSQNYTFEVLDKNLQPHKIDIPFEALKVVSWNNLEKENTTNLSQSERRIATLDQVIIEVDKSKIKDSSVLKFLKQSRSYNNPIKLNNDAYYDFVRANNDAKSYYMVINNQGYFINDNVSQNIKNYETKQISNNDNLAKELGFDNNIADNKYPFNSYKTMYDANNFNITTNIVKNVPNFHIKDGMYFKGWNDNYFNKDWNYNAKMINVVGLNYDQEEWFNIYDFNTNTPYLTASNLWTDSKYWIKDLDEGKIVKVFKGYINKGNSGQGLMNTKYELADKINNDLNINQDMNLNKDNYKLASEIKKTNTVAYDELKYIITSGITDKWDYQRQVDKYNIPVGFNFAESISPIIINDYMQILEQNKTS